VGQASSYSGKPYLLARPPILGALVPVGLFGDFLPLREYGISLAGGPIDDEEEHPPALIYQESTRRPGSVGCMLSFIGDEEESVTFDLPRPNEAIEHCPCMRVIIERMMSSHGRSLAF
jgi:hypothetical protein